jgi:transglutaminase-like putative cysteine protease
MKVFESNDFQIYLEPTTFIDSNSPNVIEFALSSVGDAKTPIEKVVRLFYAVRDEIRYDPYHIDISRDTFRASVVLANKSGFCVEKALLLAAAARVVGIPSRLRFADVRNHLTTEQLKKLMETDLFIFHGYTELYLNNKWVKATPTFNRSLCERFGVHPIDFDGVNDSIFHEFDAKGKKHMEYVNDHGYFADLPYETIMTSYQKHYPLYFTGKKHISTDEFEKEALKERGQTS